jgi:hypothetical protein
VADGGDHCAINGDMLDSVYVEHKIVSYPAKAGSITVETCHPERS